MTEVSIPKIIQAVQKDAEKYGVCLSDENALAMCAAKAAMVGWENVLPVEDKANQEMGEVNK